MTRISTIHEAFRSVVDTTLTGYTEIANPFIADENPIHLYNKSYGLAFGPGINTNRLTKPKFSRSVSISLVLINKINFTETNEVAARNQQREIQEDLFSCIEAVCNDGTIDANASKFEYVDDSGIEFVDQGKIKFYLLEATFNFEYFESL